MERKDPHKFEGNRSTAFTIERRDRCVEKIMAETGCDRWTATIAYRISTAGLHSKYVEAWDNE